MLARKYDISPALLEAVVWQESRWHSEARSSKGAHGLAQLMPGTSRDVHSVSRSLYFVRLLEQQRCFQAQSVRPKRDQRAQLREAALARHGPD